MSPPKKLIAEPEEISAWAAIDLVKQGYYVETLPRTGGVISYGKSKITTKDLSNYKVFIVTEPNIQFTMAEKDAIINFVKNGGGLYIFTKYDNSDIKEMVWSSVLGTI